MKLLKKLVRGRKGNQNQWCVTWKVMKERKEVYHREWFIHEEDADNFIKEKNEKI